MPENSILANANNIVISGGSFQNNNIHPQNESRAPSKGLDLLLEKSALSARVDSNARYDAPKCDEGTRKAIIQKIMDWIESDEERASTLWLHGPAGSGKSALAKTIAELCMTKKGLIATFFFTRTRSDLITEGNFLIPTLAYQLAEMMVMPRKYITKVLLQDPGIFYKTRELQAQRLVIDPLGKRLSRLEHHYKALIEKVPLRLIVIDGLDECSSKKDQCDLLQILGKVVETLRLPIRFLIASRPETQIRELFDNNKVFNDHCLTTLDLGNEPNTARDIQTYYEVQFTRIRNTYKVQDEIPKSWPSPEDITTLVERASGQFIYASTVVGYSDSRKHNPVKRLAIIIERAPLHAADNPYRQLDQLYRLIFISADQSGTNIDQVLQVLGILIVQRPQGVNDARYNTYAGIGQILDITSGDVFRLLEDFVSLIGLPPSHQSNQPIRILHASLVDFLLESSRSCRFHVDKHQIHLLLASYYASKTPHVISEMNYSTHRDHWKRYFSLFEFHWRKSGGLASHEDLCKVVSLLSQAMVFLCHCPEQCEDVLRETCHRLILELPPTVPLVPEWIKGIAKQRPIIITLTVTPDSPPRDWSPLALDPTKEGLQANGLRKIGKIGPNKSYIRAVQFARISSSKFLDEIILVDVPWAPDVQRGSVLEWLKRLASKHEIKVYGILFCHNVLASDMDWIKPGGKYRELLEHFQAQCPVVLLLMRWEQGLFFTPTRHDWSLNAPLLMDWQEIVQYPGNLLWCNYSRIVPSGDHILLDVLSENETWNYNSRLAGFSDAVDSQTPTWKEIGRVEIQSPVEYVHSEANQARHQASPRNSRGSTKTSGSGHSATSPTSRNSNNSMPL